LPIGNFSAEFGGQAAFWCNATVNWYFIVATVIAARHSYYHYQLAKQLDILPSLWGSAVKLVIALGMAATTGVVYGLIANGSQHSLYNEIVTGLVNVLLNYIGSVALLSLLVLGFSYIANKCYERCCQKADAEDTEETVETASWIVGHLNEKMDHL